MKKKKQKEDEQIYLITMNKQQMDLIALAVEQYSRMICGQLSETYLPSIEHAMWKEHYLKDDKKDMGQYCAVRDVVDEKLEEIKAMIWNMPRNAHYGIGYDNSADLGYELYKVILFQREKERMIEQGDKYTHNVHSSNPLSLTEVPFITIEKLENNG